MSFRQTLNRNSTLTTTIVLAATALAIGVIVYQAMTSRSPGAPAREAYFTIDDGASWFAEDIEKVPPFDHNGKQAVRVYVFKCSDGKPFAAYLERFTANGKKAIEDARAKAKGENTAPPDPMFIAMLSRTEGEVKRPKDSSPWIVAARDPGVHAAITGVKCADGDMSRLHPVMP